MANIFMILLGLADLIVGVAVGVAPDLLYKNPLVLLIAAKTGLHESDASAAPGFNNAISLMVIAIAVGTVRAGASSSRDAQASIVLMRACWSVLNLAVCWYRPEVASAVHLLTGANHIVYTILLYYFSDITLADVFASRGTRARAKAKED